MVKKVEEFILKRYHQDYERREIARELAKKNQMIFVEAEQLVNKTLLEYKNMKNRKGENQNG